MRLKRNHTQVMTTDSTVPTLEMVASISKLVALKVLIMQKGNHFISTGTILKA